MEVLDKELFYIELDKRITAKEKVLESSELKDIEKERIEWQISGMKLVSGMIQGLFTKQRSNDKTMNSLKKYKVTFKDGKSEIVEGKVFLFNESAPQVPITKDHLNLYNSNLVQSIKEVHIEVCPNCDEPIEVTDLYANGGTVANVKHCLGCNWSNRGRLINERTNHCDNKTSVAELPERFRGIKISETSLNIRNEIIKNDIDYLKDITPEQMELLVQLFKKENNRKLISDMSLQRKIDALGLAPIDSKVYKEHLKHMESIGVGVRHFKYYKLYGQTFMPYSQEYLLGNSIEHLLKRDKENYKRFCPLFFGRLKRRIDRWLLR